MKKNGATLLDPTQLIIAGVGLSLDSPIPTFFVSKCCLAWRKRALLQGEMEINLISLFPPTKDVVAIKVSG